MACTGLAFPNVEHFVFVALVAFVGTINPSTGDLGVLVPIEHAMLAHGVTDQERTRTFARYSLIGALSMAAGSLAAAAPDFLALAGIGTVERLQADVLRLCGAGRAERRCSTGACRMRRWMRHAPARRSGRRAAWSTSWRRCSASMRLPAASSCSRCWRCGCSSASTCRCRRRACSSSGQARRSAFSYPVAAWLAKRIGLINTMVYTHIPSSILLILAAFSPNLYVTLGLLLLRAALSQMDVPTRTSYVMAVVTPPERAAAASFTAVPRSLASAISPAFAGVLLTTSFTGLPLVICGVLKIVYDVALLFSFRHTKPPEEQPAKLDGPRCASSISPCSFGFRPQPSCGQHRNSSADKLGNEECRGAPRRYTGERVGQRARQRHGGIGKGRRRGEPIGRGDVKPDRIGDRRRRTRDASEDREQQPEGGDKFRKPLPDCRCARSSISAMREARTSDARRARRQCRRRSGSDIRRRHRASCNSPRQRRRHATPPD